MADVATTVLVASAEADVREILARVVETAGFEAVRLEPHAAVAGAVLSTRAQALVLDLGADNLPTLRDLRDREEAAAAEVRVVVIGTGPAGGRLATQAGADGYLVRPFHADELRVTLTEALARTDDARRSRRTAPSATSPS